ncbi:MAG: hypothetical protein KDK65_01255, partial [Chlamydiia bacterium]|nr:hypothetical protein [Chlamydiia bacterium]
KNISLGDFAELFDLAKTHKLEPLYRALNDALTITDENVAEGFKGCSEIESKCLNYLLEHYPRLFVVENGKLTTLTLTTPFPTGLEPLIPLIQELKITKLILCTAALTTLPPPTLDNLLFSLFLDVDEVVLYDASIDVDVTQLVDQLKIFQQVRKLVIECCHTLRSEHLITLINQFPLQELRLVDVTHFNDTVVEQITNTTIESFTLINSSATIQPLLSKWPLVSLTLFEYPQTKDLIDHLTLKTLKHVSLTAKSSHLRLFWTRHPQLESFHSDITSPLTTEDLTALTTSCKQLRALSCDCSSVSDLSRLSQLRLNRLALYNPIQITDFTHLPHTIQKLTIAYTLTTTLTRQSFHPLLSRDEPVHLSRASTTSSNTGNLIETLEKRPQITDLTLCGVTLKKIPEYCFGKLTALHLIECSFSASHLKPLKQVQELSLERIPDFSFEEFTAHSNVQILSLCDICFSDPSPEMLIPFLSRFTSLQTLDLTGCNLTFSTFAILNYHFPSLNLIKRDLLPNRQILNKLKTLPEQSPKLLENPQPCQQTILDQKQQAVAEISQLTDELTNLSQPHLSPVNSPRVLSPRQLQPIDGPEEEFYTLFGGDPRKLSYLQILSFLPQLTGPDCHLFAKNLMKYLYMHIRSQETISLNLKLIQHFIFWSYHLERKELFSLCQTFLWHRFEGALQLDSFKEGKLNIEKCPKNTRPDLEAILTFLVRHCDTTFEVTFSPNLPQILQSQIRSFHFPSSPAAESLRPFLQSCPRLIYLNLPIPNETLHLPQLRQLTMPVTSTTTSETLFAQLKNCSTLDKLYLTGKTNIPHTTLEILAKNHPFLQSLNLSWLAPFNPDDIPFHCFRHLDTLDLSSLILSEEEWIRLFTRVRTLNENADRRNNLSPTEKVLVTPITSISLRATKGITVLVLMEIRKFPELTILDLSETTISNVQVLRFFPKLRALSLRDCGAITDHGLQFLQESTSLHVVDVRGCLKLTPAAIAQAISKGKHLLSAK